MKHAGRLGVLLVLLALMLFGCSFGGLEPGAVAPVELPAKAQGRVGKYTFTRLENAPDYYRIGGWLDRKRLVGLSQGRLVIFNVDSGATEDLEIQAWNIWVSPDREQVAFNNEAGLSVLNLKDGEPRLVAPVSGGLRGMGVPEGVVWAPDSKRLVYRLDNEGDSTHHLVNLATGTRRELNTELEAHFLNRAVAWPMPNQILFQTVAAVGQDGAREYSELGYRGDLAVFDLKTGRYDLISAVSDGEFLVFQGMTDEKEALFIVNNRRQESKEWGLIALDGSRRRVEPIDPKVVSVQVVPGKPDTYLSREAGLAGNNMRFELLTTNGNWESAVTLAGITSESGLFFFQPSLDGKRVVFGFGKLDLIQNGAQIKVKEYFYLISR